MEEEGDAGVDAAGPWWRSRPTAGWVELGQVEVGGHGGVARGEAGKVEQARDRERTARWRELGQREEGRRPGGERGGVRSREEAGRMRGEEEKEATGEDKRKWSRDLKEIPRGQFGRWGS